MCSHRAYIRVDSARASESPLRAGRGQGPPIRGRGESHRRTKSNEVKISAVASNADAKGDERGWSRLTFSLLTLVANRHTPRRAAPSLSPVRLASQSFTRDCNIIRELVSPFFSHNLSREFVGLTFEFCNLFALIGRILMRMNNFVRLFLLSIASHVRFTLLNAHF